MKNVTLILLFFYLGSPTQLARTIVVDLNGEGEFTDIQEAIDTALPEDTIQINHGTYLITQTLLIENKSLTLEGIPNAETSPTIGINNPAARGLRGIFSIENSLEENPESFKVTIKNLTLVDLEKIEDPKPHSFSNYYGVSTIGALQFLAENIKVKNCYRGFNIAGGPSKLVNCTSSQSDDIPIRITGETSVEIVDSIFSDHQNSETLEVRDNSHAILRNCTFKNNGKNVHDNLIPTIAVIKGSSLRVFETSIDNSFGPGIECDIDSGVILHNSSILNNTGAGLRLFGIAEVRECIIKNNRDTGIISSNSLVLENCLISNNYSKLNGGGLHLDSDATTTITSSTIIYNSCPVSKGGGITIKNDAPQVQMRSSILWGNSGSGIIQYNTQGEELEHAGIEIEESCIQGDSVFPGSNNINSDPQFCGIGLPHSVFVDAETGSLNGRGTLEDPFLHLSQALCCFNWQVLKDSPCKGTGRLGSDRGIAHSLLSPDSVVVPSECRTIPNQNFPTIPNKIFLAKGIYPLSDTLYPGLSIEGAGKDQTFIRGAMLGARGEISLRQFSLRGSKNIPALSVGFNQPIELTDCVIEEGKDGVIIGRNTEARLENLTLQKNMGTGLIVCPGSNVNLSASVTIKNFKDGIRIHAAQLKFHNVRSEANSENGLFTDDGFQLALFSKLSTVFKTSEIEGEAGIFRRNGISGFTAGSLSKTHLQNCIFDGNIEYGFAEFESHSFSLSHCIFAHNIIPFLILSQTRDEGDRYHRIRNSIIYENLRPHMILFDHSKTTLKDSLLYNNVNQIIFVDGGESEFPQTEQVTLSDGRTFEVRNPFIRLPDYHLVDDSEAINAGALEFSSDRDFDGRKRPCGGGADLGIYENEAHCGSVVPLIRGDLDRTPGIQLSDPINVLRFLFLGKDSITCKDAADVDDDGEVNMTDSIILLTYLFLGGPPPLDPHEICGSDDTLDELECESSASCEVI